MIRVQFIKSFSSSFYVCVTPTSQAEGDAAILMILSPIATTSTVLYVTIRPARLTIVPSFVIQLFRISLSITTLDSIERVNQAPTAPRLNSEFRRHPVLVSLLTLLRYVHIRIMINISCSYHDTKRILASWHSSAVQSDTPVMGVT